MTIKKIKPSEIQTTRRKVNRIFIHCSASSRSGVTAKTVDDWHKARGWAGIGYHMFLEPDGSLWQGRDINKIPAAQAKNNTGTIAICLHGGGGNPPADDFTQAQFKTLNEVADILQARYPNATFHGHREVAAKACPVFDYKTVLGLDSKGRRVKPAEMAEKLRSPVPSPADASPPKPHSRVTGLLLFVAILAAAGLLFYLLANR